MNELDVVVAWLASVAGGPDCGICNWLNNVVNDVNNIFLPFGTGVVGVGAATVGGAAAQVIRDPIGTASDAVTGAAGVAGTAAGTAVNVAGTAAGAAVGVAGTVAGATVDIARDAGGAFNQGYQNAGGGTSSPPPPAGGFGRGPTQSLPGQMPQGTLNYFNSGGPTGSQIGGEQ
jgi:hypothetical protein